MNSSLDRWIQTTTVAVLIALAATLLGFGVALYGPHPSMKSNPLHVVR